MSWLVAESYAIAASVRADGLVDGVSWVHDEPFQLHVPVCGVPLAEPPNRMNWLVAESYARDAPPRGLGVPDGESSDHVGARAEDVDELAGTAPSTNETVATTVTIAHAIRTIEGLVKVQDYRRTERVLLRAAVARCSPIDTFDRERPDLWPKCAKVRRSAFRIVSAIVQERWAVSRVRLRCREAFASFSPGPSSRPTMRRQNFWTPLDISASSAHSSARSFTEAIHFSASFTRAASWWSACTLLVTNCAASATIAAPAAKRPLLARCRSVLFMRIGYPIAGTGNPR
jgi:hypothetical protein